MSRRRHFRPHILIGTSWINFYRWLFVSRFKWSWEGFTRLLTSSWIIFFLTPFRIIEWIASLFQSKPEVEKPIFILGHPRSGTTYFHDTMNEFDGVQAPRMIDCLFPFMNKHFEFLLVPILKKALPETRLMDKMKVKWDSPQEEEFGMALTTSYSSVRLLFQPKRAKQVLNDLVLMKDPESTRKWMKTHLNYARKLQRVHPGKRLVFKSPGNTARMKELAELYPDATFIHIVRDPQAVIPSTIHLYNSILPEFSLQDYDEFDVEEFVFEYYVAVMEKYEVSKVAIEDERLYEMRYEDFVTNPIEKLSKAFSHLNIDLDPTSLTGFFEGRKKFKKNKFVQDEELVEKVKAHCSSVAEKYGYA